MLGRISAIVFIIICAFGAGIAFTMDGGGAGSGTTGVISGPPLSTGSVGTVAPSDFYVVDVTTDGAGNLYAIDQFRFTVSRYTPDGMLQLQFKDPEFKFPRRVAVDDTGRIYVTDRDQIRVYSAVGIPVDTWSVPGLGGGGIQFVALNLLYVALERSDAVAVFDTEGNELERFGTTGSFPGQFRRPVDVAVSTEGDVYVADLSNRVQKFDASGSFVLQWGGTGSEPGQLNAPHAISLDSSGNLFVSDRRNSRVQKFDASGNFLLQWGSKGRDPGQFLEHNGLEVAPDDTVWVAGYHANDIQRFDNDGNLLDRWRGHVSGPSEFANFGGVAIVDDLLFVVDNFNNRIQVFDVLSGKYQYVFGERGQESATVFNFPKAITAGPDGDLYITDDNDVKRIRPDGTFVRRFLRSDGLPWPFSWGVAVSLSGMLFQVDFNNDQIMKWDAQTGQFLFAWGESGSGSGQFSRPRGIALGPDETVFVADRGNSRIQRFSQDGVFIEQWSTESAGGSGEPLGLAIDPVHELVYVGLFGAIGVFDLKGRHLYSFNWSGTPPQTGFNMHLTLGGGNSLFASVPNIGLHKFDIQLDSDSGNAPVLDDNGVNGLVLLDGGSVTVSFSATDIDSDDNLTFDASANTLGAAFFSGNSLNFVASNVGTDILTVTVTDSSGLTNSINIPVTVNPKGSVDSNGDGMADEQAVANGLDPILANGDTDGDGVLDSFEIGDPGNAIDSDGDGVIDALEIGAAAGDPSTLHYVISSVSALALGLDNFANSEIMITVPTGTSISMRQNPKIGISLFTEPDFPTDDSGYDYPEGLFSYSVTIPAGQSSTIVTIQLPSGSTLPDNAVVRKLDNAETWQTLTGAVIERELRTITLTLIDNDGVFDTNPAVGIIGDPVGIAVPAAAAPPGGPSSSGGGGCVLHSSQRKGGYDPLFVIIIFLAGVHYGAGRKTVGKEEVHLLI